jgi:membrane associated rhomboid family serine protease
MQDFRPRQFNLLPDVVKNLMIINGLFYLATLAAEQFQVDLSHVLGLHYVNSNYFEPYQIVTHMFMHGGFLHLFSNMFALWMFGSMLENVWGPKRFLFFYLFTGLGAALIHSAITYYEISSLEDAVSVYFNNPGPIAFKDFAERYLSRIPSNSLYDFINGWSADPNNSQYINEAKQAVNGILESTIDVPTVGASGAVFGVLLAFGMLFPNMMLYIYFLFPIKAKYFVFLYAAFELYAGYQSVTGNSVTNIAHFAHLGGMLFAYILIKYWQKKSNTFY